MRRALHRSQPLHSSRIGKAEGSHISARPPLLGCPLDGVKSVTALVFVRPKFAAGSVPATHILYDNRISTLDCAVKDRHFKGTNHSPSNRCQQERGRDECALRTDSALAEIGPSPLNNE